MPKCQVNYTELARQDLIEIVEYISGDNITAAFELADLIEKNIVNLSDFPLIGVVPKNRRLMRKGYRMLIIDNYIVFYVLLNEAVMEVRRIVSSKRNYNFLV